LHLNYHRKGYGTEALNAMTNFIFNDLVMRSIEANSDVKNTATMKLLEKCGFKKEAHFKENYFFNGTFLGGAIYCLVKQ